MEWTNTLIKMCPLEYKKANNNSPNNVWNPIMKLYGNDEHIHDQNYLMNAILNHGMDGPIDSTEDSIKIDNMTDMLLHMNIGQKLQGNKKGNWQIIPEQKTRSSKLGEGLQNVRDIYLGSVENIRANNKKKLKEMKLTDKLPLKTFVQQFRNRLNQCREVGSITDFDTVKDIWMEAIKFNRMTLKELNFPLIGNEVKTAIKTQNMKTFIQHYVEDL